MRSSTEHPLLDELLTGAELDGFREATLKKALAAGRKARRRRNISRTMLIAVLPAMLVALVVFNPSRSRSDRKAGVPVPGPVALSLERKGGGSPVELISDAELLALFPGRPLALVGPEGRQELVFLDQAVTQ